MCAISEWLISPWSYLQTNTIEYRHVSERKWLTHASTSISQEVSSFQHPLYWLQTQAQHVHYLDSSIGIWVLLSTGSSSTQLLSHTILLLMMLRGTYTIWVSGWQTIIHAQRKQNSVWIGPKLARLR